MRKRGAVLLLLVLAALALLTGRPAREQVWEDLPYTLLHFDGGLERDLSQGGAYGVMNSGPGLTLPAGTYRVKWRVESDGDNALRLSGKYGLNADRTEIPLPAGQEGGEAQFELREAVTDLTLGFSFEDGTRLAVRDLRLYSPRWRDSAFLLAFVLLGAAWLICAWPRWDGDTRTEVILLSLAAMIACAPAFKDTIGLGHDTAFHLVRLQNLADGLRSGQFPVRVGGFSYNGFGAATSVFYPDFFLVIPALLMVLGCSLAFAVNIWIVLVTCFSGWAMRRAAGRMFGERWTAAAAAVLYMLSIYRLSDVYTRFALGEMTAMAFLPLFLLGLWEAFLGDARRWRTLALSAAAVCLCHVLSTALCALLALAALCLGCRRLFDHGRLCALLKAALCAALLCAFWLVPLAVFSRQGLGAAELMKDPARFALHPAQLFLLGEGELAVDPLDPALATFSAELGLPMLLGAALALIACARDSGRESHLALLLTAAGAACAFASTTLFPWGYVRLLTRGLSDYLQFPWRLLMFSAALFALAGGWGAARFAAGHGEKMTAAALALAALCALPTLSRETRNNQFIPFGEIVGPDLAYTEYTLPGTRPKETRGAETETFGDVSLAGLVKRGTRITAEVQSTGGGEIALPLYGFDGYRARLNEQELAAFCGEDRRLHVTIPAGSAGSLRVWYQGVAAFRWTDALSLAALAGVLATGIRRRKDRA